MRREHVYLSLVFSLLLINIFNLYRNYNKTAIDRQRHTEEHETRLDEQVRILCLIPYSYTYLTAVHYVKRTWARHCNKVLFVSGDTDEELEPYVPIINATDTWQLVSKGFTYAHNYHGHEADWFLKVTDWSFVVVENLRYMLKDYSAQMPIYFGYKLKDDNNQPYMFDKSGYVVSKEALRRFTELAVPNSTICNTNASAAETIELGRCLRNVGVIAGDSRDESGRHTFLPYEPEITLFKGKQVEPWLATKSYYKLENHSLIVSKRAASFIVDYPAKIYGLYYFVYKVKTFDAYGKNYTIQKRGKTYSAAMKSEKSRS